MPLVSVIIPSFNSSKYLEEAINSVIQQTYLNWELLIVDDGSTDEIDEVVAPFLVSDKRINYVKKDNGGLGSARNYGIKNSNGTYILPLDADDKFDATYIEKAVHEFSKNPKLKIVYCEAEFFGTKKGQWKQLHYNYNQLLLSNMIFAAAMYKKEDYDSIGGYDESIAYEDWDFWLRLLKNGGEVYRIPEVLFYYRQHEKGSLMNNLAEKGEAHQIALRTIFNKNKDAFITVYGNPIEIELKRQKLLRELNHPLHKWVLKNKRSLLGRLLLKFVKTND